MDKVSVYGKQIYDLENQKRIAKNLDMENAEVSSKEYDDTEEMLREIEALPTSLNWNIRKGDK